MSLVPRVNIFYKILVSSYAVSTFAEGIILPIYAIFVQDIGGDILDASGAFAVFLLTEGIATILIHRVKRTRKQSIYLLIGGRAIRVAGLGTYLLISNIWILFLAQILTALGNAIANPIFDKELSNHTDSKLQEFERGFFEGLQSIGSGIAALMGGLLAKFYGFSTLIIVMVIIATLSLILILLYVYNLRKVNQIRKI